jgi:hypothetical protein
VLQQHERHVALASLPIGRVNAACRDHVFGWCVGVGRLDVAGSCVMSTVFMDDLLIRMRRPSHTEEVVAPVVARVQPLVFRSLLSRHGRNWGTGLLWPCT